VSLVPKDLTPVYKETIGKGARRKDATLVGDVDALLRAQHVGALTDYLPRETRIESALRRYRDLRT
jgi:hypothetical protein